MSDPKRMLSDPELGELLRADLDASAKHTFDYDLDKGLARHVALVAGGAAAATAAVSATASATTATATTATATTAATTAAATTTATATGVAAGLGVKTMIAAAAIGVATATATGGVIAVTSRPEPKPAAVTASQPSQVQTDKASSPSRAKADAIPQTDMPNLEPTVTPDQLPIATPDKAAPNTVSPMAEMDNYVKARGMAPTDPAGALALLDDGNRQFSRGVFVEEREALAIDCLVRLGRTAEAKQRGQAFLAAHPTSTFAEKIRQQTDSR